SPLAPVILCLVHRILFQQGFNLVNKFALLLNKCWFTQDSWDKPKNDGGRGRGFSVFSQSGRSIIEMLGVLAIIGVLSIGGIAGYSKAMEKFKVNKLLDEYTMLLYGLLGNASEFRSQSWADSRTQVGLIDYAQAASLVPETWKKVNDTRMTDSQGNVILLFSRSNRLVMDIYIGGVVNENTGTMTYSTGYSASVCRELMQNLAQPLHGAVQFISFYRWTDGEYANLYRGDKYCVQGEKCLRDITLAEINDLCKSCEGDKEACAINMEF
ncbi:MAG: hypothetical protein SPC24_02005, partial [Alphaproteobacteria bacterium]|nr:hypothetical protein [Alphaproteobacteria bacterium]